MSSSFFIKITTPNCGPHSDASIDTDSLRVYTLTLRKNNAVGDVQSPRLQPCRAFYRLVKYTNLNYQAPTYTHQDIFKTLSSTKRPTLGRRHDISDAEYGWRKILALQMQARDSVILPYNGSGGGGDGPRLAWF